jgi:predicted porin
MKKSLIALAVAGVVAAPAFAATSNVDIYGQINVSVDRVDNGTGAAAGNDAWRVNSNTSRFGMKGSEDLGGGMKGLWQIEQGIVVDTANAASFGAGTSRNTFLGLGGDFGTVLVGSHDTPYKLGTGSLDPFADTVADYNSVIGSFGGNNTADLRLGNVVAYISPTVSGFHAAIAKSFQDETGTGTAAAPNPSAYSMTAIYSNGPLFGSLSYEKADDLAVSAGDVDTRDLKLGLGYTFGDTKVGFVWERLKLSNDAVLADTFTTRNAWLINVAHAMGPITLKASYANAGDVSGTNNTGAKVFNVGVDYAMSKRTSAYVIYSDVNNDAAGSYDLGGATSAGLGGSGSSNVVNAAGIDNSSIAIGMRHSF